MEPAQTLEIFDCYRKLNKLSLTQFFYELWCAGIRSVRIYDSLSSSSETALEQCTLRKSYLLVKIPAIMRAAIKLVFDANKQSAERNPFAAAELQDINSHQVNVVEKSIAMLAEKMAPLCKLSNGYVL